MQRDGRAVADFVPDDDHVAAHGHEPWMNADGHVRATVLPGVSTLRITIAFDEPDEEGWTVARVGGYRGTPLLVRGDG
jgi:hypothetical protein